MPSNYSDSPSMDEILERIKRALAQREESVNEANEMHSNPARDNDKPLTFEQMKEYSSSREITDKITETIAEDEIFIKPIIRPTSTEEVKPLTKRDEVTQTKGDVFVLTKTMKRKKNADLNNVDFDMMFKNIASELGHDLAISYLSPKIESWLRLNFNDIIAKSQKK